MRRILAFLIMAALLTANLEAITDLDEAWGGDNPFASVGSLTVDDSTGVPALLDSDNGCDHCCHAGAHLAGLAYSTLQIPCGVASAEPPTASDRFNSVSPLPDLRPPIV